MPRDERAGEAVAFAEHDKCPAINVRHTACNYERRDDGTMADKEFEELKREFLAEARDKVQQIETFLDDGRGLDRLERMTYLAHQLKGSGGSYGFQRISTDAAQLERAVELLASGSDDGRLEEKIQQYVVNIRAEIDKRQREMTAEV
jgi:HPt (histidine-containing phosphotransfer) domain-containing protein